MGNSILNVCLGCHASHTHTHTHIHAHTHIYIYTHPFRVKYLFIVPLPLTIEKVSRLVQQILLYMTILLHLVLDPPRPLRVVVPAAYSNKSCHSSIHFRRDMISILYPLTKLQLGCTCNVILLSGPYCHRCVSA